MSFRLSLRAICFAIAFLAPLAAGATNRTWSTLLGNGDYGTNSRWSGGAVPGVNDKATFSGSSSYTVTFNTTGGLPNPAVNQDLFVTAGNVTFTSAPGAPYLYHLSGSTGSASITGGMFNLGTGSNPLNMTIDEDLIVRAALNINAGSVVNTKDLLLAQGGTGTIIVDGTGSALNVSGTETNLAQGGSAQLTYRNNSAGSIAGILSLADDIGASTATLNVETGADLTLGRLNIGVAAGLATGTVNVNGAGSTVVQTGASSLTVGTTSAGTGTLKIGTTASGGSLTTGTGLFTINKKGTVSIGSASTSGVLNANGNVLVDGGTLQSLNIPGNVFQLAAGKTVTVQNGGHLIGITAIAANTIYNISDGNWIAGMGTTTIDKGAVVNVSNGGQFSHSTVKVGSDLGSGTLSVGGAVNAALANCDSITVGYNSTVNVGTSSNGFLTVPHGIQVDPTGTVNIGSHTTSGGVDLSKKLWVSGGVFHQISSVADLIIRDDLEMLVGGGGRATFDLNGGTFGALNDDLDSIEVSSVNSKLEFVNGTSFTVQPSATTLDVRSGGTLSVDGQINLLSLHPILKITNGTVRAGAINGSPFQLIFNSGEIAITGPAGLTLGAGTLFDTNYSIQLDHTLSVTNTTTIPVGGSLSIDGGTFNTGSLVMNGPFTFNSGVLGITGPTGFAIGAGQPLGSTIMLDANRSLHVTNTLTINAGAKIIALSGGELSAGNLVNNGDLVAIDTSVDAPVVNNQNVTVVGSVTFNGLVSGPGQMFGPGTAHFNGGFSPGASPANVSVEGSVDFNTSNTLFIEIGGATAGTQYDRLAIAGSATLDGMLDLSLLNGFTPAAGQQFTILTANNIVNNGFVLTGAAASSFSLIVGSTSVILQAIRLTGDYNGNGVVDAADYVIWRNSTGLTGPGLAADGNENHQIDSGDYDVWRSRFGQTAGNGAGGGTAVPEPNSLGMALVVMMAFIGRRRAFAVPA